MTLHERKGRWFAVFVAALACILLLSTVRLRSAGGYNRHTASDEGGLDSLVFEGHELHASLQTRPHHDLTRNLPPGMRLPENPHVSTDSEFVEAVSRGSSQGRLGSEGIRSALYALYVGEGEIGFYGLEAESVADADRREEAIRDSWAHNTRQSRASVYRAGLVLLVIWHDDLSPECWSSVNARVADRLNTSGSRPEGEGSKTTSRLLWAPHPSPPRRSGARVQE